MESARSRPSGRPLCVLRVGYVSEIGARPPCVMCGGSSLPCGGGPLAPGVVPVPCFHGPAAPRALRRLAEGSSHCAWLCSSSCSLPSGCLPGQGPPPSRVSSAGERGWARSPSRPWSSYHCPAPDPPRPSLLWSAGTRSHELPRRPTS